MFRKEALDHQKWKSTALLLSSISARVMFFFSFLITASFILYITFGSYTRWETILDEEPATSLNYTNTIFQLRLTKNHWLCHQ